MRSSSLFAVSCLAFAFLVGCADQEGTELVSLNDEAVAEVCPVLVPMDNPHVYMCATEYIVDGDLSFEKKGFVDCRIPSSWMLCKECGWGAGANCCTEGWECTVLCNSWHDEYDGHGNLIVHRCDG